MRIGTGANDDTILNEFIIANDDLGIGTTLDSLVIRPDGAMRLIDYKTGRSAQYADTKQLKLLSAALFTHFPEIKVIKAGLLFVVAKDFIKETYDVGFRLAYFEQFRPLIQQLEAAIESGVWNPKRNFTCKGWCPVKSCQHWEERRSR
jgi:hypothetical protein